MRMKRAMACGSQAKLLSVSHVLSEKRALHSPFVDVEDFEAERCQRDLDQGYDYNADCNAHAATGDSREHLSANDAVDRCIAFHQNDVEQGNDLGRIISHEEAHHNLKRRLAGLLFGNEMSKRTIVLFPLTAPQVAIYAVDSAPSATPKIAHRAQSTKPSSKSSGPVKVTARLLIVRLALNHNRSICSKLMLDAGCRSLSCTRARPRASKPARPSIRAFHLLNQGSLEMSVDDVGVVAMCSSIVPFSSTSAGPMRPVSEDMTPIQKCTWERKHNEH
jgi:hypothetical protein